MINKRKGLLGDGHEGKGLGYYLQEGPDTTYMTCNFNTCRRKAYR